MARPRFILSKLDGRKALHYLGFGTLGAGVAWLRYRSDGQARFSTFPVLDGHNNLMADLLTKPMYAAYAKLRTPSNFGIDECIQPGVDNKGDPFGKKAPGLVAGDPETYDLFFDLFDGVVSAHHKFRRLHQTQAAALRESELRVEGQNVLRVSARLYRNLYDFPFSPAITRGQRRLLESRVAEAVEAEVLPALPGAEYRALKDLKPKEREALLARGVDFVRPDDPRDESARVARDWPDGRALLVSMQHNLSILVNGRHHLEFAALHPGPDLGEVLKKVGFAASALEQRLGGYVWKPQWGYMGYEPAEIGSGMLLEATVYLPRSTEQADFLKRLVSLGLKVHAHTDEEKGIWRLQSRPSFDPEPDQAAKFVQALNTLCREEAALASA